MSVSRLQQIRLARGHATESVARTGAGDGALIAMDAAVVTDLQEERAVSKTVAALDTFRAADAQLLVNGVFVVGVFDERAFDGGGGAKLILGGSGERIGFGLEITRSEIAIAAHGVGVNALHRGLFQYAFRGAIAAPHTFLRVNLPDPFLRLGAICQHPAERAEAGHRRDAGAVAEEGAPGTGLVDGFGVHEMRSTSGGSSPYLHPGCQETSRSQLPIP